MIIIVEGQDRCGKSTLVKQLRHYYIKNPKTIVHHSSAPPTVENCFQWEVEHYTNLFQLSKTLNTEGWDIIFDRFHLGAAVYGKLYRDVDSNEIFKMDHRLMVEDCVLIVLVDEAKGILSREDGDSLESTAHEYDVTKKEFIYAYASSSCKHKILLNISAIGFDNVYQTVVNYINEIKK